LFSSGAPRYNEPVHGQEDRSLVNGSPMRRAPVNLPNALTAVRIFLVPLLVVVLLTKFEGRLVLGIRKELVGAAIFGLASLTDWLDGYLARRRKEVTTFGQIMDPLADKLLVTAALVSLVQMDVAPAWIVAVIVGRELAVTVLRSVAHGRGFALPASPLGKVKMASEVGAILLLILGRDHVAGLVVLGQVGLWLAMITAVVSAFDYYRRYLRLASPVPAVLEGARRGPDAAAGAPRPAAEAPDRSRMRA
jgi:CDP-diacylglycerol---glycerol-3-phosphate 3-phosphatidyltransferase